MNFSNAIKVASVKVFEKSWEIGRVFKGMVTAFSEKKPWSIQLVRMR